MTSNEAGHTKPKKSVLVAVCAAIIAAIAAWFGFDSHSNTSAPDNSATKAPVSPTTMPATSPAQVKDSAEPTCSVATLPPEADEVIDDILAGGPFEYAYDDGDHFGNYERKLPSKPSSYYKEYTVETPGVNHRGARRIVTGGGTETDPDVWYYTEDHYESFCFIPDAED